MLDPGTFGKNSLLPFIGLVVEFDSQGEQAHGQGFGWRYKVRIIGDYSKLDTIKEEEIRYAIVMLPTTAGSGGGGRLTTPRIVQGDLVFGYYANNVDGLPIITGVFPRSSEIDLKKSGSKLWDILSGFWEAGNIKPGILGNQEVNEHNGVSTPILGDGKSKVDREPGNKNLEQLGLPAEGESKVAEKIKPKTTLPDGTPFTPTHPDKPTHLLEVGESNMETFNDVWAEQKLVESFNNPDKSKSDALNEYKEQTGSSSATAEAAYNEVRSNEDLRDQQIAAAGVKQDFVDTRSVPTDVVEVDLDSEPAPERYNEDGTETEEYLVWRAELDQSIEFA